MTFPQVSVGTHVAQIGYARGRKCPSVAVTTWGVTDTSLTGADMSDRTCPTPEDVWRMDREREARFRDALTNLVEAAGPVWGLGDGFGGYVQQHIAQALTDAYGPLQEPPAEPKSHKRRKIDGTLRAQVMERDRYRCVRCGSWEGLSLDHIHPLSKGGTDDADNLQTMCRRCNSAKGARV